MTLVNYFSNRVQNAKYTLSEKSATIVFASNFAKCVDRFSTVFHLQL